MNKGLEALNNLLNLLVLNYTKMSVASREYNDMKVEENLNIVVKELKDKEKTDKALEIIKRKLPSSMRSAFLYECDEEEYDLLKEVGL